LSDRSFAARTEPRVDWARLKRQHRRSGHPAIRRMHQEGDDVRLE
jgi:hypothetical protein